MADALSRSPNIGVIRCKKEIRDMVMKTHEANCNRKNIYEKLPPMEGKISKDYVRKILKDCETWKRNEDKVWESAKFVKTTYPGEIVAFDFLEISRGERILLGIDYFTRTLYGKCLKTKEAWKVIDLLQEIHKEIRIKTVITDCGKEFDNEIWRKAVKNLNIKHEMVAPYYHQANGSKEQIKL